MLDQLYQLFCVPKPPSLSISDLKCNNFNQFIDKTMMSSLTIDESQSLQKSATDELSKLIAKKSNSPSNTKRMINDMFKSAAKACRMDRERALIHWLEICVFTALDLQDTTGNSGNNKFYTEKTAPTIEVVSTSTEKKRSTAPQQQQKKNNRNTDNKKKTANEEKKTRQKYESETDVSWEEDDGERYELIGASDDDYIPSDDEAVVPKRTRPVRKTAVVANGGSPDAAKKKVQRRKKKNEGQVDPPSPSSKLGKVAEATLPVLKEGAGSKAVVKYFNQIDAPVASKSTALLNGYFARAFFFPSSDSFNAFISVLNSATKTIDICVFAFTDDDVADALIAAKKRNVAIRIITDNQQAAGKGADAKRLSESYGIPFKTDNTTGYMHNKFAIVDSATLINGSFNWSKGARFKNRENIMVTNIPLCIKEFQAQFDALWTEF